MSKINVLTPDIYNKISAGEVVENPAGAVKELVENSVDAGATRISVDVYNGGFEKIIIVDNGSGISDDDIVNAFKKHATSKISEISDLYKVATLGFRGEALSSIAAVSKIELTTKTKNEDAATYVALEAGEIIEKTYTSGNTGTKFVVKDLFYNTPARKKFFKSQSKESLEITKYIAKFILTNPNLSIEYRLDGQLVYSSKGQGIEGAIYAVYGNCIENCLKVNFTSDELTINGYIGSPDYAKANRTYQTLSVNNRPISDFGLTSVIAQAYKPYLMTRKYAVFVLNIDISPEMVDVNVHPKKTEVRFARQDHVFGAVYRAVSETLKSYTQKRVDEIFDLESKSTIYSNFDMQKNDSNLNIGNDNVNLFGNLMEQNKSSVETYIEKQKVLYNESNYYLDSTEDKKQIDNIDNTNNKNSLADEKEISDNTEEINNRTEKNLYSTTNNFNNESLLSNIIEKKSDSVKQERLKSLDNFNLNDDYINNFSALSFDSKENELSNICGAKIIGVAFKTYLIIELDEKIIFIDQHAAHERILYEKFMQKHENVYQNLMFPYVFTTKNDESNFINDNLDVIKKAGIEIEQFGINTYRIIAVDSLLIGTRLDKFVEFLLGSVEEFQIDDKSLLVEKIAKMACKAAIKAGYELNNDEISILIKQIIDDKITQCPHGRPICIVFTKSQLEKMFKRTL